MGLLVQNVVPYVSVTHLHKGEAYEGKVSILYDHIDGTPDTVDIRVPLTADIALAGFDGAENEALEASAEILEELAGELQRLVGKQSS